MSTNFQLDKTQIITLCIIGGYILGILILWNIKFLNFLLFPFKLVTVAFHEFGHAAAGICTGAKIESIHIDPEEGGATVMKGGWRYCTLPAGYIGSCVIGATMVFAGFNVLASKIVGIIIGLCLLVTLWFAKNWLTRIITVVFCGLIAFLWWFGEGEYLRYVVLFMGVMSCMYSLWDIIEDLISRRVNESDASKFAKEIRCCPAQIWGLLWFFVSTIFLGGAIVLALIVF